MKLGQYRTENAPSEIKLYGLYESRRFLVRIDDVDLWLPLTLYRFFFILAISALMNEKGYVHKDWIDTSPARDQYLFKLRRSIEEVMGAKWLNPIEALPRMMYLRLGLKEDTIIHVDMTLNKSVPDEVIRRATHELQENYDEQEKNSKALTGQSTSVPLHESTQEVL